MDRKTRDRMMDDFFKLYREKRGKRHPDELRLKWGVFKYVDEDPEILSHHRCMVGYRLNKSSPLVWLRIILLTIPIIFINGFMEYKEELGRMWGRTLTITIGKDIAEKYIDDFGYDYKEE